MPNIADVAVTYNLYSEDIGVFAQPATNQKSWLGAVTAFTPPAVVERMHEYSNGTGFMREIPIGLEKLETTFTLMVYSEAAFQYLSTRKVPVSGNPGTGQIFHFRQSLEQGDGEAARLANHEIRGHIKGVTPQATTPDGVSEVEVMLSIDYYHLEIGGASQVEVDLDALIYKTWPNGTETDHWAARRTNLGLSAPAATTAPTA